MPAGVSSAQCRSAAVLNDALGRLPLMPRTLRSATWLSVAKAASLLVPVAVMQVGVMRMPVAQPAVLVPVRVRLAPVPAGLVAVPVVQVVHMLVRMRHGFVHMLLLVALRGVQPYPRGHQRRRDPERRRRLPPPHEQRERGGEDGR